MVNCLSEDSSSGPGKLTPEKRAMKPSSQMNELRPASVQLLAATPVVGGIFDTPASAILEAFGDSNLLTDQLMIDYNLDKSAETIIPKSTQLCIALTVEAFESLGCSFRSAEPCQN